MPGLRKNASGLPTTFTALVQLFPPSAVHDEVGYDNVQEVIDALLRIPQRNADQNRYLDTLSVLMEAYEAERYPVPEVSPVEVVKHLMESHGMTTADLGRVLGDKSVSSRILSGERELSKGHIRKLAAHFGVSPAVFF